MFFECGFQKVCSFSELQELQEQTLQLGPQLGSLWSRVSDSLAHWVGIQSYENTNKRTSVIKISCFFHFLTPLVT